MLLSENPFHKMFVCNVILNDNKTFYFTYRNIFFMLVLKLFGNYVVVNFKNKGNAIIKIS